MRGWMWVSGLALLVGLAQAQAPMAGNAVAGAELTPAERAQRDADKVFKWIRIQADKPVQRPVNPAPPVAAKNAAPVVATKQASPRPPAESRDPAPTVTTAQQQQAASEPAAIGAAEPTLLAAARITAPPPAPVPAVAEPEPERPLKALAMVEPEMPRQLPAHMQKGVVLVRFTVQPDGTVRQAEVLKSTHPRMSDSALEAVSKWRFEPISQARVATVEVGFSRD